MRSIGVLGVLCFAVVPAFGDAVEYTFDVIRRNSDIVLSFQSSGSTIMSTNGTFTATIYQSDGHIGSSDTLLPTGLDIANTETGELTLLGVVTASLDLGSLRLTDFIEDANYPGHIGEGGTFTAYAAIAGELTMYMSGLATQTVTTTISGGELLEIDGTITTSGETSDTITVTLDFVAGSIPVQITVLTVTTTIYMDLDVHLEATAHHAPDPSLGGLVALGLGGAGTWLRRRRLV